MAELLIDASHTIKTELKILVCNKRVNNHMLDMFYEIILISYSLQRMINLSKKLLLTAV